MRIRAVVVDDHDLARVRLRDLLEDCPGVEWVGEASNGERGLELIATCTPDVAFLDIQMPGISGLEVLRRARPRPFAIFTTAYDQHAVDAFELHALDYLLKPFGKRRLSAALDRVREQLHLTRQRDQIELASRAFDAGRPLERIFVQRKGAIEPVEVGAIEHLRASGDYVELCEATRASLVRATLDGLLARLDPVRFVRIHRSHAISLAHVAALRPYDAARLEVVLASGKRVVASRSLSPRLRERIAL